MQAEVERYLQQVQAEIDEKKRAEREAVLRRAGLIKGNEREYSPIADHALAYDTNLKLD